MLNKVVSLYNLNKFSSLAKDLDILLAVLNQPEKTIRPGEAPEIIRKKILELCSSQAPQHRYNLSLDQMRKLLLCRFNQRNRTLSEQMQVDRHRTTSTPTTETEKKAAQVLTRRVQGFGASIRPIIASLTEGKNTNTT